MDSDAADNPVRFQAETDETPTEVVNRGVATLENQEPKFTNSVYDSIDPDGVDSPFQTRDCDSLVKSRSDGYRITYRNDGLVTIREAVATGGD